MPNMFAVGDRYPPDNCMVETYEPYEDLLAEMWPEYRNPAATMKKPERPELTGDYHGDFGASLAQEVKKRTT